MPKSSSRIYWTVVFAILLLTRVPAAAQYFSIDNINLAFSLEKFDPINHQPQPPGYPFFVAFARLVNLFFGNAHASFVAIAVLASGLCLPLASALGARLFSKRAGQIAPLLLLLNPVFWHSGLDGPLRPNLALFSLLVAYCAWRTWTGERRFALWGALALGVGSGFRPDLLLYLGPVWLVSVVVGTRSVRMVAQGLAVLVVVVLAWVGALVYAVGGPAALYKLISDYLIAQSAGGSVLLGAEQQGWLQQVNRLVTWNGLAVLGWFWAIPFALLSTHRLTPRSSQVWFLACWLVPGLAFQALVHVANPGHTLFSVVALCVLGGYVIWAASEYLSKEQPQRLAEALIAGTLVVNLLLFLNFFPFPTSGGRVKMALATGTWETSLADLRGLDDIHRTTVEEWERLSANRPSVIVTTEEAPQKWFMHYLMLRYYAPQADIWVLARERTPPRVRLIRRDKVVLTRYAWDDMVDIPVPQGGRIVWVTELGGEFQQLLNRTLKPEHGIRVSYTDIAPDAQPFEVLNFRFVPTPADQALEAKAAGPIEPAVSGSDQ